MPRSMSLSITYYLDDATSTSYAIVNGSIHTRSFFFHCMFGGHLQRFQWKTKWRLLLRPSTQTSSTSSPVFPQYNCCRQQTSRYHQPNQLVGGRFKLNHKANWVTLPSFATRSTKRTLQETQTSSNMKISWTAPPSQPPPTSTSTTTTKDKTFVDSTVDACTTKGHCARCGKADASRMCPRCGITSYCSKECYR